MAEQFTSISGTFKLNGDQRQNAPVLQITLSRDPDAPGNRFSGTWNVDAKASDARLNLTVSNGEWKLSGWCDDAGDHNNIILHPSDSAPPLVTLVNVGGDFISPWRCGVNFGGAGNMRDGTKIDYQLGVLCV